MIYSAGNDYLLRLINNKQNKDILEDSEKIGNKAVEHIIKNLKDKNYVNPYSAVRLLYDLKLLKSLITELSEYKDMHIRNQIIYALITDGSDMIIEGLNYDAGFENYLIEALNAIEGRKLEILLVRINEKHGIAESLKEKYGDKADPFIRIVNNKVNELQNDIITRIRKTIEEKSVLTLIEILSKDEVIIKPVLEMLKDSEKKNILDMILPELKNENREVQYYSAEALKNLGDHRAVEPLLEIFKDKNEQSFVFEALKELKDSRTVEKFTQILEGCKIKESHLSEELSKDNKNLELIDAFVDNEIDQLEIIEALAEIDSPAALEQIIKFYEEKHGHVEMRAMRRLVDTGAIDLNRIIMTSLKEATIIMFPHILGLAFKNRKEESLKIVMEAIYDDNPRVRLEALGILGYIGDESIMDNIVKFLCDENKNIRLKAIEILSKINNIKAMIPLMELLGDENTNVRVSAGNTILKIKSNNNCMAISELPESICKKAVDIISTCSIPPIKDYKASFDIKLDYSWYRIWKNQRDLILNNNTLPVLLEGLQNEDENICCRSLITIGAMKETSALENMFKILKKYNSRGYRHYNCALWALGMIGEPAIDLLITKLDYKEEHRIALEAIGAIGWLPKNDNERSEFLYDLLYKI